MNSVERVKQLCKERKIAISRLERDLGFANGYISQLRKGSFPAERLAEIAKYFSVSPDFLMTGEIKTPAENGEREMSDQALKFALFGDAENISSEDLEDVRRYAAFIKERKKKSDSR